MLYKCGHRRNSCTQKTGLRYYLSASLTENEGFSYYLDSRFQHNFIFCLFICLFTGFMLVV